MFTEKELQGLSRDDLEMRFMRTLSWYFSEKRYPTGFLESMPEKANEVSKHLGELNTQLAASAKAQQRLATALNFFTFLLVLLGALQIYLRP